MKNNKYNILTKSYIVAFFATPFLLPSMKTIAQCNQIYNWANWNTFSSSSATGSISTGGQIVSVTMSANYQFGSSNNIYGYGVFNNFSGDLPSNTTVPETTWSIGTGGMTTMCFSQTVSNPVLLLASIGRPGVPVTLHFSKNYVSIFTGQNVTFVNDTTIIGEEGYTILMFPGNFECVTIFSSTPEYYTNITWGLNPPLFPINISGNLSACKGTTLTASGGSLYTWSGGKTPNSSSNLIEESGIYFLTVTDNNGCTVVTSQSVEIIDTTFFTVDSKIICQGESYEGYNNNGTFIDTLNSIHGCDSIRTIKLTVLPKKEGAINRTICQGQDFQGYNSTGVYIDTLHSMTSDGCDSIRIINLTVLQPKTSKIDTIICKGADFEGHGTTGTFVHNLLTTSGCDSIRTINLTVEETKTEIKSITICGGSSFNFNGKLISKEGIYADTLRSGFGCDSIITMLNLTIAKSNFLGKDITLCSSAQSYTLSSPSDGTIWFDNTISKNKIINKTGEYWAKIVDANGCEIVDTVFIQFNGKSYVPNAFSPNDDGNNDCFSPNFSETTFSSYRFNVLDRWGELLFSTEDPTECWNGKFRGRKCDNGIYIYFIEFETKFCDRTILKGDVAIIK